MLAALPFERDEWNWVEVDVADIEIDDLMDAGAGVVEQQKQSPVISLGDGIENVKLGPGLENQLNGFRS